MGVGSARLKRADADRSAPDDPAPRPAVADASAVLALQRTAGNGAVARLLAPGPATRRLQRQHIESWGTQTILQKKKLPPFIEQFGKAVADLKAVPPGLREKRRALAEAVFLLGRHGFEEHLQRDKGLAKFRSLVVAVAVEAKEEANRLEQRIEDFRVAGQREQDSRRLPAGMAAYAQHDPSLVTPDVTPYLPERWDAEPSYAHALSVPRGHGDELTAEAIAEMNAMAKSELIDDIDAARRMEIDTGGKSADEIQELMDAARNPLSGATKFPELENVVGGSAPARERITAMTLGGVAVQVTHDENDVTLGDRTGLLGAAINLIAGAGVAVPAINAVFPRLARGLAVSGDCVVERGERKAAVFKAPNTVFLPEHIVANPKLEQASATKPFFLSTALDATGVATTVHELGHLLHYQHNPSGFHLLQETFHAGPAQDIKAIESEVSAYASKNPREFVAEVFLGLVYGRRFSPAVMNRYAGLRGMPVPAAAVAPPPAAPGPTLGSGKTIAYPSKAAKKYREAQVAGAGEHRLRRLRRAARAARAADRTRYLAWKAMLTPPPPGAIFDDHQLRIELPYNYQVVREQHAEFGKALEDVSREFFTDDERKLPGGDGLYSSKDLAGKAFNDPAQIKANERAARRLLKDARTEFKDFDFDAYDRLFEDASPQELAAELAALPEAKRVGHLLGNGVGSLIVGEEHGNPKAKELIVDNIDALVAANVDTLYVEHFRRNDYQALLDDYNASAGQATPLPAPLARLVEALDRAHLPNASWPRNLKGVVELAHRRGLKVMGMDASAALTRTGEGMERRAARMNFVAAEAVKADVGRGDVTKFIMLVGEAHVHTHERGGEAQSVPGLAELLGAPAVEVAGDSGVQRSNEKVANR